jgi:hypothetical protein
LKKLPHYDFSSQAIDVPIELKPSHGGLNNSETRECSLHDQMSDRLPNSIDQSMVHSPWEINHQPYGFSPSSQGRLIFPLKAEGASHSLAVNWH